jgi:cell division protein FtsW (lipid II flippase)
LLILVFITASLGFFLLSLGTQISLDQDPWTDLPLAFIPPLLIGGLAFGVHGLLRRRRARGEQTILPVVFLLLTFGLLMIWRLRGAEGFWQQVSRGLLPGLVIVGILILRPWLVEGVRRWAVLIAFIGLLLPLATAFFGEVDETGARLALKLGPLPAVQPSELIKLSLVIFLAWYIDREGRRAEGRARPFLGWLRLPPLRYFLPGVIFVALATFALVQMSDFGAVPILTLIFIGMLFAGFETRIFLTVASIGLALALVVALLLASTWDVPQVIQMRFLAFQDPWSEQMMVVDGQTTGISISEGPGYQIQQSIYAIIAGGLSGTGLGLGTPGYVPLAHSDFIFAAIVEELGAVIGLAILFLFGVLMLRILRVALLLPGGQVFERLLVIGICIHISVQVFIMVGGTLNMLPMTGVTIPFISQGGMALLVNLVEIGLVLSISQRLEGTLP